METNQTTHPEANTMKLTVKEWPSGYYIQCASDHPDGDPLAHLHNFIHKAEAEAFRLPILSTGSNDLNPDHWDIIDPNEVAAWDAGYLSHDEYLVQTGKVEASHSRNLMPPTNPSSEGYM